MTSGNPQRPKYKAGDVPKGRRFHENTAHKPDDGTFGTGLFLLESKVRPMLIIGTPGTGTQEYTTLDFTSHRPTETEKLDYLLKERNDSPRSFGKRLGFDCASYLKIYPIQRCPEGMMHESTIDSFPKEFVHSVIRIAWKRLMNAETQDT